MISKLASWTSVKCQSPNMVKENKNMMDQVFSLKYRCEMCTYTCTFTGMLMYVKEPGQW